MRAANHTEKCKKRACSRVTRHSNIRALGMKDRCWSAHPCLQMTVLWTLQRAALRHSEMQTLTTWMFLVGISIPLWHCGTFITFWRFGTVFTNSHLVTRGGEKDFDFARVPVTKCTNPVVYVTKLYATVLRAVKPEIWCQQPGSWRGLRKNRPDSGFRRP